MRKLSVILRTEKNLGNHGDIVSIAHDVRDGETVEQLMDRLIPVTEFHGDEIFIDFVELRRIKS